MGTIKKSHGALPDQHGPHPTASWLKFRGGSKTPIQFPICPILLKETFIANTLKRQTQN